LHAFNKVGRSIESEAEQIPPTSHSTKKGRKIRTTISTKAQHKKGKEDIRTTISTKAFSPQEVEAG
jgi:hypothetical protein